MLVSYHNHTGWSDGNATLDEQILGARDAGLDELGISDHYVMIPDGPPCCWSMPLDRLPTYVAEILDARNHTSNPRIRLGVEADFFPETVETLREELARHPFDYIIGSVHFVDSFPVDSEAEDWQPLTEEQVNEKWELYWTRIRQLAESRVYDFAAHLDLPKKFGFHPTADLSSLEADALDAIASADMAIEINTAGWHKPCEEAYPSIRLLWEARRRDIPLLINADAHVPAHLTRDYGRAWDLAREAGYTELVRYEARRRIPYAL